MDSKVIVIAEAGVNHNGDLELAKKLIDVACDAKADFVKFQSFSASTLVAPHAKKAEYQMTNTGVKSDNQFEMLKSLELSHEDHQVLIEYCNKKGIEFLSTPFSIENIQYLVDKLNIWKIPSGEVTNHPMLKVAAKTKKPIILSTGMASLQEVKAAFKVICDVWSEEGIDYRSTVNVGRFSLAQLTLLHCTTAYPTPVGDVNLRAMITLKDELNCSVGYSDHTDGILIPSAAVAMGATLIEKHFTLDRKLPGPDHKASLEPNELISMIESIRRIEEALGSGIKKPVESERKNIEIARKSLFYGENLRAGVEIKSEHIKVLRPGDGLSPTEYDNVLGKILKKDCLKFDYIKLEDLK